MNFLVDAQLPPGLASWLADHGHTAQHVHELDLLDAEDAAIWDYALEVEAIIVTKDEDFAGRKASSPAGPAVIWLRIGNATNRALFQWLEPRWPAIAELLNAGNTFVEVR